MSESTFDLDAFLADLDPDWMAEYERRSAQNKLKQENPYVFGLIKTLAPHAKGLHRSWVIDAMENDRKSKGLDIPEKFEAAVQSAYNHHSIDSSVWRNKGAVEAEGIFHSPEGKGSGKWAVDRQRARAWVQSRVKGSSQ